MGRFGTLLTMAAVALALTAAGNAAGPETAPPPRAVVMGADHLFRWADTGAEARFFGVNYVGPFAYTYRALGYRKADREKTIRRDIMHLQRMGLNALRMHVWDNEISDREGNLVPNDHLRLLDYVVAQCGERGIHVLLTPIAWLGNGYPEPNQLLEGFSSNFRKSEMGVDPAAIAAQARYLDQFVRHVNAFTHRAYKDDPTILGFEFVNEPWSPPAEKVEAYVAALATAVRGTGCTKPLFYCASQSAYRGHNDALQASPIDGVTFGWYPSGLVSHHTIQANYLPYLDTYPLMQDPAFAKKAKLVYEFDAADIENSCYYPAFARTFRTNGVQWATQFAYCPLPLADSNTPYSTHYLNLLYTPAKAVSMRIAAEAFRTLPAGKDYGHYPENTTFGLPDGSRQFRVDYRADRSEMLTDRAFFYSNDTEGRPAHPEKLEQIIGCGSSRIVTYAGSGSYFLEKQAPGAWRLEVYPDSVTIADPHGNNRLDREAKRLVWRTWPMTVHLPDLGDGFSVEPLNVGNDHQAHAKKGAILVRPGVYLLTRPGVKFSSEHLAREFPVPAPITAPPPVVQVWPAEAKDEPGTLFRAGTDYMRLTTTVQGGTMTLVPATETTPPALSLQISAAGPGKIVAVRYALKPPVPVGPVVLRIRARALTPVTNHLEIALVDIDGVGWSAILPLSADGNTIDIPIESLRPMSVPRVPAAYPMCQRGDLVVDPAKVRPFRWENIEGLEFVLRGETPDGKDGPLGVAVESVTLAVPVK